MPIQTVFIDISLYDKIERAERILRAFGPLDSKYIIRVKYGLLATSDPALQSPHFPPRLRSSRSASLTDARASCLLMTVSSLW